LRALYYRGIVKDMESNVMIEQGVFLAHPKSITLKEFSFLDKNVVIMARNCYIGRRVHIAVNSFVNGGGDFYAGDYSGVSPGCQFMTSTEVLKGGARCSGPMVSADQRNVHRGKVVLEKDAFVGAGSTILTDVIVAEGSVIGGGVTVSRSTEPWGIYVGAKPALIGHRDKVKHPDN
jgi:acetyltransferase-like isoleucine patch superfamily enzyme